MSEINQDYRIEGYDDNWSYWYFGKRYPEIDGNVHGNVAFAVVNPDGTFDSNYPLFPVDPQNPWQQAAPPGCDGFAIGGWNNSQPGGGLYDVLTSKDPKARQRLIDTIVENASKYGYKNVVMDYENYQDPPPDPALYTQFLQDLGSKLHSIGVTLEIAISPEPQNARYFDLSQLVSSGAVDRFHLMTYDYAMGLSPPIRVQNNASLLQTMAYVQRLLKAIPPEKMMLGVPFYGLGYQLQPGMTPEQVRNALNNDTLTAKGYADFGGVPTITDDALVKKIGDWEKPTDGWTKIATNSEPPDYYYYQESSGTLISAFPPASIDDFAQMILQKFPDISGVFSWQAQGDFKGEMMQRLIDDLKAR